MAGWFGGAAETLKALQADLQERASELSAHAREAGVRAAEKVREQAEERGLGDVFTLDDRYRKQEGGENTCTPASPPWETVPEAWKGQRAIEWEALVRSLSADEASFTVGPREGESPLSEEESAALAAAGVGEIDWRWEEGLDSRTGDSEAALSDEGLSAVRHALVPRAVKEADFWTRYWWKLRELGKLAQTSQVRPLLRVLNAGGRPDVVAERVEEAERARRKAAETLRQCEEEMRTSSDNVALLRRMQQRSLAGGAKSDAPDELMESVYESCKYHKQKVGTLMARLEDLPPAQKTGQLAPGSDLFARLEEVNTQLGAVLAAHRRGGFAAGDAPVAETEKEEAAADSAQAPSVGAAVSPPPAERHVDVVAAPAPTTTAEPSAAPSKPAPAAAKADDPFGDPLPWDD